MVADPQAIASLALALLYTPLFALCIVNPNQQSANYVIYVRRPNEIGPDAWQAGVRCLDTFSSIFFQRKDRLARSYNLVLTNALNMSTPAAQIQQGFLKNINEAISEPRITRTLYQLRVVADVASPHGMQGLQHGEVRLADYYVIVVDDVRRLKRLMRDFVSHMHSWNPGGAFLVLYHRLEHRNRAYAIAEAIFEEMLNIFFINRVAVLFAESRANYSFWTMDYFHSEACRTLRLSHMADCHNGTALPDAEHVNRTLQRSFRKLNLANCTFNMCSTIQAPFVEADCVAGIELRILGVIKDRLKFELNQSCELESRGVRYENGSWSGLLGKLNNRYCDFICGGIYPDNEVLDNFWASDCYMADSYTWFVKLADPRPAWKALYAIFAPTTWLCFVGVLLVSWFSWFFFVNMLPEPRDHKDFSLAGLNAMGVLICYAVEERPLYNASRLFFLALTLCGMNTVAVYTSKLIAVFQDAGHEHQLDNLNGVLLAGIPFGGREEYRDWFENDEDMWIYERFNDSDLFEPITDNLLAVKRGERVLLCGRMYILQHRLSDQMYAFPYNVFSSPLQLIMKPGFPFLSEINLKIGQMRDGGIFSKIQRDFYFNNTILNRIAKMRPHFQDVVIVLTIKNLEGPFAIYIIGILCSVLCFLLEHLFCWCLAYFTKRRQNWKPNDRAKQSNEKMSRPQLLKKQKCVRNSKTHKVKMAKSIRLTPIKRRVIPQKFKEQ